MAGLGAVAGMGALALGVGAFFFSGLYNVAASVPHFAVTEWLIEIVLGRSVALHSAGVEVPDLEDPALIRLGANHFEIGCAPCHGSPAAGQNPVVESMYPEPPPLDVARSKWDDAEVFWIVRHGIRMTGMPAWAGRGRDREPWAVTAFVRRLPGMEAAEYEALVPPLPDRPDWAARCAACHGDAERPPIGPQVPALQGQKSEYLLRALREYRDDARQSGIMEPIAAAVPPDALGDLARSYAAADRPAPSAPPADAESLVRGRAIAERGLPEAQVPPCLACHSPRSADTFPLLAGLSQDYLAMQLALFAAGVRAGTAYAAIMGVIAPRLTAADIADVTGYFASLPPETSAPDYDPIAGEGAAP